MRDELQREKEQIQIEEPNKWLNRQIKTNKNSGKKWKLINKKPYKRNVVGDAPIDKQ